ncbi:MAG: hypothetical protein V4819_25610 [Verrucomicrobiota bacterium]
MKALLALLVLSLTISVRAKDDVIRDPVCERKDQKAIQDPLTIRALDRLEKQMDIKFNIPFPADFDPDAYQKRPLALIPIGDSKVCATRPILNPYDEPHKVEWMIGPANPTELAKEGIECSFDLDERGDFFRLNLIADWASDGGTHQLWRSEGESGPDFFERARLTYQFRAKKAKEPAQAELFLTTFEKMAVTIQALRKEEARGGAPNP